MADKNALDYARIYYKLGQILEEKDKKEELEKEGYRKDGLCQLNHPTLKYKLVKIVEIFKEEKVDDINEMLKLIMHITKGQNNPKQILNFLKMEIGEIE